MKKILIPIILIVSIGVAIWYFYFYDNVVTSGEAYGFSIGDNKEKSVSTLREKYNDNNNIIILSPGVRGDDVNKVKNISVIDLSMNEVIDKNVWQLRFNGEETDVLVLYFEGEKLVKMFRYRRLFIP
jgi:hypothetical protein